MQHRSATAAEPYHYRLSGLPVSLVGIDVWHCPECRSQMPVIPRLTELHQVIAGMLARKPMPLTGAEIRSRMQIGMAAQRFALLLGVSPSLCPVLRTDTRKILAIRRIGWRV